MRSLTQNRRIINTNLLFWVNPLSRFWLKQISRQFPFSMALWMAVDRYGFRNMKITAKQLFLCILERRKHVVVHHYLGSKFWIMQEKYKHYTTYIKIYILDRAHLILIWTFVHVCSHCIYWVLAAPILVLLCFTAFTSF